MNCTIPLCTNPAHSRGWCRKHYMRWHTHGDPNFAMFVPAKSGEPMAFIDAIPVTGQGCLQWPFATNGAGYGQINMGHGKKALVSRLVCERRHGPPPSRAHQAAHTCGNGHLACVAPWHLEWKTPAGNNADQDAHGTRSRGDRHARKLTSDEVRAIRASVGLSQERLADLFGVSQTMVGKILRREVWRAA